MTISNTTDRVSFAGDTVTTTFSTSPVVFFDNTDLDVIVVNGTTGVETPLTITTDYTVSGGSGAVGTVATTGLYGAIGAGNTLVIVRDVPATQGSDFVNNDGSDAEVVERAFDRLTMVAQQLDGKLDRTLRFSDAFTATFSATIPAALPDNPGASFIVNDAGTAFTVGPTASAILAAAANATAAATSATAAAASATAASASATSAASSAAAVADMQPRSVMTTKGDLYIATAAATVTRMPAGNNGTLLMADSTAAAGRTNWAPRNHISGLIGSNAADADHDVTFTVGEATDDSAAYMMFLTAAMTKQADATWAAGSAAGAMVSGESLPTSGQINWWLIAKTDGTTDICCNNHATTALAPTLPTGYTLKRLIRSDKTDASANIIGTLCIETAGGGMRVQRSGAQTDIVIGTNVASPQTYTAGTPLGYSVMAEIFAAIQEGTAASFVWAIHHPDVTFAPKTSATPLSGMLMGTGADWESGTFYALTNTSGQVETTWAQGDTSSLTLDNIKMSLVSYEWSRRL